MAVESATTSTILNTLAKKVKHVVLDLCEGPHSAVEVGGEKLTSNVLTCGVLTGLGKATKEAEYKAVEFSETVI